MRIFLWLISFRRLLGSALGRLGEFLGGSLETFWGAWGRLGEVLGTAETPCGALWDIWGTLDAFVASWGLHGARQEKG